MKIACDLIKPWLVPFSEGTLRVHRPFLHAAVRRHLSGCASCRQDEVLLHKTAMALRRHSQMSPFWSGRPSRLTDQPDVPLSSRVLQSVQMERGNLARRATRTVRGASPIVAYATSVVLLGTFFAFLTQPTIARPWIERYFHNQSHNGHAPKSSVVTPPYPMHDPFAIPVAVYGNDTALGPKAGRTDPFATNPSRAARGKVRAASLPPVYGRPIGSDPFSFAPESAGTSSDVQAREAMTTAERAEETRMTSLGAKPVPVISKPFASAGSAILPVASPAVPTIAPVVVGRGIVSSSAPGNNAPAAAIATSTQTKTATPAPATVKPVPPIPDPVPETDSTSDSSSPATR